MAADSDDVAVRIALLRNRARLSPLWLPVEGTSMGPRFPSDAEILVVNTERAPRFGEIWLYCSEAGAIVAHRFFRRTSAGLVFRGDAGARSDAPVEPSQLIGRVIRLRQGEKVSALPMAGAIRSTFRAVSGRLRGWLRAQRDIFRR